jgi:hypothetical protein
MLSTYAVETESLVLFYPGVFSQWYPANFETGGVVYNCAEQYMMSQKALLFSDHAMYKKIMHTADPAEHKEFGRAVANFQFDVWVKNAKDIVTAGNYGKFSQNLDLQGVLLATYPKTLVEASPTDKIWGIGMSRFDPKAKYPSNWKGTNWLGLCLMRVRELLRDNTKIRMSESIKTLE